MSAIITEKIRVENANAFIDTVTNNSVYVAIGKSDWWSADLATTVDSTAPDPESTLVDVNDFWRNLSALKRVTASDIINVTRRHDWTSGETYVPWDDSDEDIWAKDFYVITDEFKVYKCIEAGAGASTVKPTQTLFAPQTEGDGYSWKYMYSVASVYQKFLTNNFMPVKTIASDPGSGHVDEGQWDVQTNSAAYDGLIYRIQVTAGGTGYSSAPAVTIHGDGDGATATAVISDGVVTEINITSAGSAAYNVAYVTLSGGGGSGAAARAILSPSGGHGTNAVKELGGFYVGVAISLQGTESGTDFIVDGSFRQIGIVKDPFDYGTTNVTTETTLTALKGLLLSSHSGFVVGDYITGGTSGAIGFIDSYDGATGILKYHQNDKTGYEAFEAEENISGNTAGSGTIDTVGNGGLIDPEVERFTGDVIFLENRAPINRSASQIEDVKIIIEF